MSNLEIGMLAKSLAGHDKDQIYLIHCVEGDYVYLVDGKLRNLEKPKKKKMKHIQVIKEVQELGEAQNEDIKKLIKEYKKEHHI